MKQKAYGTLAFSEMQTETVDQLVSLPWRAVVAIPYVRTELQRRLAWYMTGVTMGEYDSEERKRTKEDKVSLMTSLIVFMICEGPAVACANWRDAFCFVRIMLEQMLVPAVNTCAKMLRESSDLAKTLLLQALPDIHQSKPMRVNMKEPVELKPLKKIDELRRFSKKELRITKKRWGHKRTMGTLLKSSEYFGLLRKKSYYHVSGIVRMAYNPFHNEDIRDCYFDYDYAVLLRFWCREYRR